MWMNLQDLPAGKSMFTIAVTYAPVDTPDDERYYEEYDLVFASTASVGTLVTYAVARPDWPYGDDARIVGVSDQSAGEVLTQRWEGIEL